MFDVTLDRCGDACHDLVMISSRSLLNDLRCVKVESLVDRAYRVYSRQDPA
jgi:hypothetical protein